MSVPRPLERLGVALKLLRMDRGLRQDDLAEVSGVSKTLISSYESGRGNPRVITLEKLLIGLEADLGDLNGALRRARVVSPISSRVRNARRRHDREDAPEVAQQALGDFLGHLAGAAS